MKALILIFFYFVGFVGNAQDKTVLSVMEKTPLSAETFIGIDSYGDIYYLKNRTLFKQSKTGTFNFKDFQLGKIGNVDLLNPLSITVYYPDYSIAVILDNKLNEIQRISFALEPPFMNVVWASTANDSHLWIFNTDKQQLELFNYRTGLLQELSRPISETYISQKSNFNFCYVITEDKVRLYNIYGSLLRSIPNERYTNFTEDNNRLLVKKDTSLILFTDTLKESQTINISEIAIKDLYLREDFLYIYDGEFIYQITLTNQKK
ncbi:MAG: hypothetical protein CVU03_13735 [Bacteroidetes bacterium HGW-Bacteroidetes-2]|jgi:hypothetical protein|nr:MAG: hypothetical protein CVU03_13735 [Bacteroidetes bacterium HGW-Bacteroidetes-2]